MNTVDKAKLWLTEAFDEETRQTVKQLIDTNSPELEDAFYKNLEFGTGGMRGIMGVGTNRLNKYTLGQATQGLANYLHQQFPNQEIKVAIAYDVRNNSKEFGKIVADVLTANGIKVLLFKEHRPTPELSFTVRDKKCNAGIVLTASHNPPEYNGYKVYWNDGAQIVPPNDAEIINEVLNTKYEDINFNGNDSLIEWVGEEQDEVYIRTCIENSLYQEDKLGYDNLNIVFTSIHGTTYTTIPQALAKAGFTKVDLVKEQMIPSGNFPTVESPNPEEPAALTMAMDLAKVTNADIVIGTDPDGDRLGIAVRNLDGEMQLLNGNQTNMILTDYILSQWQKQGRITGTEFIGSTIVTSDVFFDLAKSYGVECKVGLTGFKWIGKMIREVEGNQKFICGGEESFGFMTGDFVRDKDSCGSILLACEVAAWCKAQGKTMYQYMIEIYQRLGLYQEALVNVVKKGKEGAEQIKKMMTDFRNNPVTLLAGSKVVLVKDYQEQTAWNLNKNEKRPMTDIPKSNVLIYYTEDGTKVAIRPSGTEPKIKFYFSALDKIESEKDFKSKIETLNAKIEVIKKDLGLV
ncbi:phospho-sugar mutase [Riemerella anatipestifer]|uniref:Phosphoglucomutase/phosphomannomutase alpha/beta/alpha domain i n=1 Tax=Riemerella anatipestifer (strain ATCC 11845 / DSM 15868 / JCM 9532 / NCTC 11014) TaxID=693978 RepID=E4TBL7_RIEAD|nr:phospho-sugar mutase [Riemerella anatipestifer]ADQ81846.1 phosphoglucomutase/phosphomannomutase alpha/beta/alpha domain I [Riemerella anatipestifer ATCC 11845 = DSM 15868]ADZ12654.1 Phosphomannomutase [Riemerella anatipestifer RA-GD]AFD55857.1 phosphoglucomutase/phosphomannomutase alpha/beta/alpha domain i [Riemerella anatipestifer ATCC 11845 = DSM 15868]MDD1525402.1 phospho-sugar mutase [Riemerella anatipestifer]MRM91560.1 phospho-sugar mutase [Riemerella anatipestifer]